MSKETQLQVEAIKNGTVIDISQQTLASKFSNCSLWINPNSVSRLV